MGGDRSGFQPLNSHSGLGPSPLGWADMAARLLALDFAGVGRTISVGGRLSLPELEESVRYDSAAVNEHCFVHAITLLNLLRAIRGRLLLV